ncbi:MAG TPA: metallophosphoesterase family protein [Kiritimatiellia bacterium]|nr:metallophosphoesterase family protein [Kiritimatiellia bacterium]HMO98042.1 metallophosphoesterase family protein [Kiritimatiellia bacterium]HMP96567.1 metallophosphoesterase family protein [Kiritimatiellia bacterium]
MKVAVLSDIHANYAALEAVLRHLEGASPQAVLVGGDIINRGPDPARCLEIILSRMRTDGWRVIRGNHEDYALRAAEGITHLAPWEQLVIAHTVWTVDRIRNHLPRIAEWPDQLEINAPDGSALVLLHASRKGNRAGLYEFMADQELLDHAHPAPSAICVGHTHVPFIRRVQGSLFVNAGAVGMPFDGDPRASYALLDWSPSGWNAEIIRVPYDRERTEAAYRTSGYLEQGGPMVPLILQELQRSTSRLGAWHRRYEPQVTAGKLTVPESVSALLAE